MNCRQASRRLRTASRSAALAAVRLLERSAKRRERIGAICLVAISAIGVALMVWKFQQQESVWLQMAYMPIITYLASAVWWGGRAVSETGATP